MRVSLWFPRSKELFVAVLGLHYTPDYFCAKIESGKGLLNFVGVGQTTHLSSCPFWTRPIIPRSGPLLLHSRRFNHAFDLLPC
jgi:hypothetical protein